MGIIAWIILGLVAGIVAKALLPGSDPGGLIVTTLLGVAGALFGGFLARALDLGDIASFWDLETWLIAIGGSVLVLLVWRAVAGGKDASARAMKLAALAILSAATLAACGGGDRLSEDEFREQANGICAEYNEKIADLGNPTSPEDIPEYVERGIPIIEEGIAELRELNPPEEMEADFDRMLDETEKTIPAARQLSEAAADQDAEAVQEAISQGQESDAETDRIATELGLDECASDE